MSEVDIKLDNINGNGADEQAASWNPRRAAESASAYLPSESSLRSFRDEAEIHAISNALKRTGWNRKRAAQLLSISYRGLLYKIRRHNITPNGAGALKTVTDSGEVQS
jgi:transcriptional regulator with GAF, ATPase, and Fis domain